MQALWRQCPEEERRSYSRQRTYRYRASISDISGQDIHTHNGQPDRAIMEVRNWLVSASKKKASPGGAEIAERYEQFVRDLPKMCTRLKRRHTKLTFVDFSETVEIWLNSPR
jgi:hypothetical protein